MDHHRNDFNDRVHNAMRDHINALCHPQNSTLPSPGNGVCVPQRLYSLGAGRNDPNNKHVLLFILENGLYLPVTMALNRHYTGLIDRDTQVLVENGDTVMIRMEWPGYRSKEYQLRTIDWCSPPKKITLSKLATGISKFIEKFITETQREQIDPGYASWRVGQNGIQVEHLRLASFEQVATGSWQVRLFCNPPP